MLTKGICIQSLVACRTEPSHRAEMCTQLLFGESYSVLQQQGEWLQIITDYDRYQGWIWEKQHFPLNPAEWESLKQSTRHVVQDYFQILLPENGDGMMIVPPGADLLFREHQNIRIGTRVWKTEKERLKTAPRSGPKSLVKKAMMYLESPYLWGGRTPWGIDCSGLTQIAYKLCGVSIPRDAAQQVMEGKEVAFVEEAREGDLAFFHDEEGKIVHTGMIIGDRKIIHASGKVRIDALDHFGIYNQEIKKYTHYLRIIKRVI